VIVAEGDRNGPCDGLLPGNASDFSYEVVCLHLDLGTSSVFCLSMGSDKIVSSLLGSGRAGMRGWQRERCCDRHMFPDHNLDLSLFLQGPDYFCLRISG
jgi:hypothetical protein